MPTSSGHPASLSCWVKSSTRDGSAQPSVAGGHALPWRMFWVTTRSVSDADPESLFFALLLHAAISTTNPSTSPTVRRMRSPGPQSRCTDSGVNAGMHTDMYRAPVGAGVEYRTHSPAG